MTSSPFLRLPGAASLQPGESRKFLWLDEKGRPDEGFVVRHTLGFAAFSNRCAHIGVSLDWDDNRFFTEDGDLLICSTHGALFRPMDGFCVAGPCQGDSLRAFSLTVSGDDLLIHVTPPPHDFSPQGVP